MQITSNALQIVLVLLFLQRECRAVRCYQCNSKKDKDCTINKVDSKYLKSCPSSHPYCRKAAYKYYFANSREYFVVRECAKWRNTEGVCYRGRYSQDSYQLVCECRGTGCNQSSICRGHVFLCVLCAFILLPILNPT